MAAVLFADNIVRIKALDGGCDGDVVRMWERHDIEGREAHDLARQLVEAFDKYCVRTTA